MKKIFGVLIATLMGLASTAAMATPEKGWHKGSYALLGIGMMNVDEDTNVVNNTAFGSRNILGYGLTFGWNFLDFLAAELQMRYGSDTAGGAREHAVNADILLKYSLILDVLTRNETVRFLPYIKGGAGVFGAAVPDSSAGNNRFGVYGYGGVMGTGMEVLIAKLFYVAADVNLHLISLQSHTNSAGVRILNGGFDPQLSVFGYFGVHF
ncbi:MAG: outer membrane beta-barrel protein [Deltaproteobacteria bacterium]|nr:outer membrane beta-barrel protein [Deltaproteobacteria bacterium]